MDLYLVQILQNKVLSGIELSENEKLYLEKYEQCTTDVFGSSVANKY